MPRASNQNSATAVQPRTPPPVLAPGGGAIETAIAVEGMDCASCVAHVEKAAASVAGVQACDVSLARGRATVRYDQSKTTPEQIADAITRSGYTAVPESPGVVAGNVEEERLQRQIRHARSWKTRALIGLVLWAPVELMH